MTLKSDQVKFLDIKTNCIVINTPLHIIIILYGSFIYTYMHLHPLYDLYNVFLSLFYRELLYFVNVV